MEKKTIGSFITALRKASGMTQKDLAEKLMYQIKRSAVGNAMMELRIYLLFP